MYSTYIELSTHPIPLIQRLRHDVLVINDQAVKYKHPCRVLYFFPSVLHSHTATTKLYGAHLLRPGIRIYNKLAVDNRTAKRHLWVGMMREKEAIQVAVFIVSVNLYQMHKEVTSPELRR